MKEKIGQLAKEKFEYQMPRLCIEPEKLLIHTEAGRAYEGSIRVTNDAGRRMKGVIFPDSLLFALPKEQFVGEEFVIPFVFHAEHAGAGDRYEGMRGKRICHTRCRFTIRRLRQGRRVSATCFSLQVWQRQIRTWRKLYFLAGILRA